MRRRKGGSEEKVALEPRPYWKLVAVADVDRTTVDAGPNDAPGVAIVAVRGRPTTALLSYDGEFDVRSCIWTGRALVLPIRCNGGGLLAYGGICSLCEKAGEVDGRAAGLRGLSSLFEEESLE